MLALNCVCFNLCGLLLLTFAIVTLSDGASIAASKNNLTSTGSVDLDKNCPGDLIYFEGKCVAFDVFFDSLSNSTDINLEETIGASDETIDTEEIDRLLSQIFGSTTTKPGVNTEATTTTTTTESTDEPFAFDE